MEVCSFCEHKRDITSGLIIGPHVSICFECVETAKGVVKHERHGVDPDICTCAYQTRRVKVDPECPHHSNECLCSYKEGGMVYSKDCPQHKNN